MRAFGPGPALRTAGLLLCGLAAGAQAQNGTAVEAAAQVPAGQTLPVSLTRSLEAGKTKPGAPVTGYVMQRVPLGPDRFLPPGAKVAGTVVASRAADAQGPAELALRFTSVRLHGSEVPLGCRALALASSMEVNDTSLPVSGIADRMTSAADWTTNQIGGDSIMRSRWEGELESPVMQKVGFADFHGVYGTPPAGRSLPRALGPFSAEANGVYGYATGTTLRNGDGEVTVVGPGKLTVRRGDALLLESLGQ